MRLLFTRLRRSLASLLSSTSSPRKKHHPRALGPERLEERTVPSGLAGGPTGCTCPFCARADAYTLGGGVPGTSPYALKWSQPGGVGSPVTITYSYSNLLNGGLGGGLPATTIKAAIQEALSRWAAVAPLRFVEVPDAGPAPSTVDYDGAGKPMIRFGHRYIDGGYNVLAYGYYPGYSGLAGDIQFDSAESWSVNPAVGQDLLEVAAHEVGHALGLAHSNVSPSIMDAIYGGYYNGAGTSFLFGDDIAGIRALYGAGVGSVTPLAPPTFSVVGTTLYVRGTPGNDTFVFDGARSRVTINNRSYTGNLAAVRSVVFEGYEGTDWAYVTGASVGETFALRPGTLAMTGSVWNLSVLGTEVIDATAGAGDQVTLTGTASNDVFYGRPTASWLSANGCLLIARGFASVKAVGNGGVDSAYLTGTTGDDVLTGGPGSVRLSGGGLSYIAQSFHTVVGYGNGGADQATLSDSAGNDLFSSRPGFAAVQGPGSSFVVVTHNFARVTATASLGVDIARIFGSTATDTLTGTATYTTLEAAGTHTEVRSFEQVYADGQGGGDTARLYDSGGDDRFTGLGKFGTMSYPGTMVQFANFAQAVISGTGGGVNRRQLTSLTFAIDWAGAWV